MKLDASHFDRSDNMKEILTLSRWLESYASIKDSESKKDQKRKLDTRNKFGYNSKLNLHLSRSHCSGDTSLTNTFDSYAMERNAFFSPRETALKGKLTSQYKSKMGDLDEPAWGNVPKEPRLLASDSFVAKSLDTKQMKFFRRGFTSLKQESFRESLEKTKPKRNVLMETILS